MLLFVCRASTFTFSQPFMKRLPLCVPEFAIIRPPTCLCVCLRIIADACARFWRAFTAAWPSRPTESERLGVDSISTTAHSRSIIRLQLLLQFCVDLSDWSAQIQLALLFTHCFHPLWSKNPVSRDSDQLRALFTLSKQSDAGSSVVVITATRLCAWKDRQKTAQLMTTLQVFNCARQPVKHTGQVLFVHSKVYCFYARRRYVYWLLRASVFLTRSAAA